ncbi:ABC transporter substrate-binding protein [Leifsonia poae]|uniref:ABC transporter substrate-binding protein n=1 Tax=Leifsonia poae TaxID=110933 RepID=UPI003D677124
MRHSTRAVRTALAIGLVAASAITLSACSASGSADDGKANIRVLANITPVLTKAYYQKLVDPFVKSHPGVTVTIESPSGKDVVSTLQQELASGDTPDVVASSLDPVLAPQMVAFPDEKWVKDTPLVDSNTVDGNIWSVATGVQIKSLVFYNETAFEKAGITTPPKSLDEFTADLGKLKDAGYVGLQTSGEWATSAQFGMMADPAVLGKNFNWFVDRNKKKVTFASSAYDTYLKAYSGWIESGVVPKDSLGLTYQNSIDAFLAGKSGTYIMGNWFVASADQAKNLPFKIGVFPTPTPDGSTPKQEGGTAQPYSILKTSKHQDIAMDLVKYLVTDKDAVEASLKSEGNFRPGFSYAGSELNTAVGKLLDDAPGTFNGTAPGQIPAFGNQLNTVVQSLYTGTSATDAASGLDTWWDANANQ